MNRIKTFPTLYSKNSNGKVIEWNISVSENEFGQGVITKQSGLYGTSLTNTPNVYIIKKGKNIGKTNETTIIQQAIAEAQSFWEHKLNREGYVEPPKSKEDNLPMDSLAELELNITVKTDSDGLVKPMKAQPFYNKKTNKAIITFPCLGQPKINGVRAMVYWYNDDVVIKSKNGQNYNIEHIKKDYREIYLAGNISKDIIFDGELYIPNTIVATIAGICKTSILNKNPHIDIPKLQHYVFDLAVDLPQSSRIAILEDIRDEHSDLNSIVYITTSLINSVEDAESFTDACIDEGHEGGIFRNQDTLYQYGKRPRTMTKLKRKFSQEFLIVDVVPMNANPELGMFKCMNDLNELTFEVMPEGTHIQKAEYLKNKNSYIGKQLTVEYRERTITKKPFHAVGIAIRDYE